MERTQAYIGYAKNGDPLVIIIPLDARVSEHECLGALDYFKEVKENAETTIQYEEITP